MAKKILIVDDDPDITVVMKFTLETHGYEVITAYDGEDGLRKAKQRKPDLIVLDVLMPRMLGDDVAKRLKDEPECRDIPIIFLTNVPSDYLSASQGAHDDFSPQEYHKVYLPKSCSEEELLAAIDTVVEGRS